MPELPRIKDRAPIYGMNSRDDPKDLREGEVVSLVNAYPGNPPIPRKGCRHNRILDTDDYDFASHAIAYITTSGTKFAVMWVKSGTDYLLIKINLTTKLRTVLGTATGLTDPSFRFIHIFDYLYTVCDEEMYWRESQNLTRHKVIEIGDTDTEDVVREMCINVAASIADLTVITGTTFGAGYLSYAFTFIRHTVDAAFDDDDEPITLTTFYPGVSEGLESLGNRKAVGSVGAFGVNFPLFSSDETPEDYMYALEQGATHIRIHRTRLLTTEALASAATHYFCMDIPIPFVLPTKLIQSITLNSNDVRATTSGAHGFATGNVFLGIDVDDTDDYAYPHDLIGVNAATVESGTVIKINGSSDETYEIFKAKSTYTASDPAGTSYASQDYFSISSIDLLTATNVRITTTAPHGLITDEEILIADITGGNGQNLYTPVAERKKYKTYYYYTAGGNWILYEKYCSSYKGLNDHKYTVTRISDTIIELQDTASDEYDYPFESPAGAPTIYNKADMVPPMTGGYIAGTLKEISTFTTPENRIIVNTTTDHNLLDDYYVKLIDMESGAEELDDTSWQVEVIDDDSFYLVGSSTAGITPYVIGGSIVSSSKQLDVEDSVTDAALAGETAQLIMTPYSVGPLAGFCEYAKTRFWLFGLVSTEKGRAYYSEVPGGSGGTPIDAAHTYPQKFLNMFNYNYFIDFSVKKGYLPTGIKRLSDDLFFFFEGEIYALFGSDPTIASPTLISEDIGCAFPDTLIIGELPKYGGQCLLYLSNLGPAITKQGGETFLFTDYRIAELWPEENRELYGDIEDQREHIIHHCAAEYWDNTWWISYETYSGVKRIFGYYFNPELKFNPDAPHGPFEFDMAEVG